MRFREKNTRDQIKKHQFVVGFLFALVWCSSVSALAQLPYNDHRLSAEQRAADLISRLTLEEKAALMCDVSDAIPRESLKVLDAYFKWRRSPEGDAWAK